MSVFKNIFGSNKKTNENKPSNSDLIDNKIDNYEKNHCAKIIESKHDGYLAEIKKYALQCNSDLAKIKGEMQKNVSFKPTYQQLEPLYLAKANLEFNFSAKSQLIELSKQKAIEIKKDIEPDKTNKFKNLDAKLGKELEVFNDLQNSEVLKSAKNEAITVDKVLKHFNFSYQPKMQKQSTQQIFNSAQIAK